MNLIVGATGMVGSEICSLLAERKSPTRALVRKTSSPDRVAQLRATGAELVLGDLKDPSSLMAACHGVSTVISTASTTLSRQEGDTIESVDLQGQLNLVAAAEAAGVKRFVFISFGDVAIDFPLQSAKRAVETRLKQSRMTYTVLQPTFFAEVWLSAAVGFDAANGTARIYGAGEKKISWISLRDVAVFAVAVLDNPRAANAVIPLGGPAALSPLEVVRLAEQVTGKKFVVEHVPEEALAAQYNAATDSMEKSFAALMLNYDREDVIDMTETLRAFPVPRLKSVQEYFQASVTNVAHAV